MPIVKKTIISTVSVILFLFFAPLGIVQGVWAKFVLRQNVTIDSLFIKDAYAVVLCSVEEALNSILPNAEEIRRETRILTEAQKMAIEERAKVTFDPRLDKEFSFFIGKVNGQVVGYVIKDTVKGNWGPIHYLLSLSPEGKIMDTVVLEYSEKRGRPIAKRRFLRQFKGKTINDRIRLKKDIRGITGASISSRGMTDGIRKSVHVFNEFYGKDIYAKK